MGKSKGVKYSSYLDDLGQLRLEKFCSEFDCSKAKAISYLLELWANGTINNKLASVSEEIQLELEQKLATSIELKFTEEFSQVNQQLNECKQEIMVLKSELRELSKH